MLYRSSGFLIALLVCAVPAWAQFKMPDQRAGARGSLALSNGTFTNSTVKVTNGRIAAVSQGSNFTPGFVSAPTVTNANPNTATLSGNCSIAGCSDSENVAQPANTNPIVMTTPASGSMTNGQYVFVYVNSGANAPTDAYFVAGSGVTLASVQAGLTAGNLTGTSAADKLARQNSCGVPPANGQAIFNFYLFGTTLILTGCSTTTPGSVINPALVGGVQWTVRQVSGGPKNDPVLATDSVIEDDTTTGTLTETLPSCSSSNVGKIYTFKKTVANGTAVNITPQPTENIEGGSAGVAVVITAPTAQYEVICSPTAGVWRANVTLPFTHAFGGTDVSSVGSSGQVLTSDGTNFGVKSRPERPGFPFAGAVSNSTMLTYACAEQWNFPANATGSYPDGPFEAVCQTAPTGSASDYIVSICTAPATCTQKADVSFAATTGTPTWTDASTFSCNAGNVIKVQAPGTTHSEADCTITLAGHTP